MISNGLKIRLFFLLNIFFIVFGYAQESDVPFVDDFSWSKWEKECSDSIKQKLIESTDIELIDYIKEAMHLSIENSINNFHIIDFDSDGKDDLIYVGDAGSESLHTVFIKQLGNLRWKVEKDVLGELVSIKKQLPTSPISFLILDSPCCGDNVYSISDYVLYRIENRLVFTNISKVNYVEGIKLPKKFDINISFKVDNVKYYLRDVPSVDNLKSTVVAEYTKSSEGIALAKEIDDTGREWWFVAMRNNLPPLSSTIHEGNSDDKYYSLGWMSSRYLSRFPSQSPQ